MPQTTSSFMLALITWTPTKQPKILRILATSLKNDQHDVSISNITLRTDNTNLNKKGYLMNSILAEICKEKKIYLTDH